MSDVKMYINGATLINCNVKKDTLNGSGEIVYVGAWRTKEATSIEAFCIKRGGELIAHRKFETPIPVTKRQKVEITYSTTINSGLVLGRRHI